MIAGSTRTGESQVGKSDFSKPGPRDGGALATTLNGPTSLASDALNPVVLSDQADVVSHDLGDDRMDPIKALKELFSYKKTAKRRPLDINHVINKYKQTNKRNLT